MKKYKIDELFTLIRNGANIKQDPNADGIPITRIETTSNDKFNRNKVGFANIYDPKPYENFILHDQDLLMSHINSEKYLGRSVLYNKKENECIIHGMNLLLLRANADIIIPRYINLYFKSATFKSKIAKITKKSVNQASFNVNSLKNIEVNIPELNEQAIIANKFDKLEALIEQNRLLLSKYDQLVKSQFIEMFGDPLSNNLFELHELNTVCDVRDGTHDSPKYHDIGYPLITSKNIIDGGISFEDVNLISKEDYDKINQRSFVDNGDILMPMIGTIGNPVIVDKIRDFAIKNVALIKFYKDSKIDNHFLYYLMKSDSFNHYLKDKNKGGTQKFVSLGIIRKIKIITPPIELQNQFADFVKHIDKLKFTLKQTLEKLENCYHSLMQEYFE